MGGQQSLELDKRMDRAKKTGVVTLSGVELKELPEALFSAAQYIKTLDISNNRLRELPSQMSGKHLSAIRSLNVSNNKLDLVSPNRIFTLATLESLDMSRNRLSTISNSAIAAELCTLQSLRQLDLSHNQLTAVPTELTALKSLVVLNLSNNHLSGPLSPAFGNLRQLEELNVANNAVLTVPKELGCCKLLKALNVSGNPQIASVPEEILRDTMLVTLLIDGTKIDSTTLLQLPGYKTMLYRTKGCIPTAAQLDSAQRWMRKCIKRSVGISLDTPSAIVEHDDLLGLPPEHYVSSP
ncbi:Leucine-rich repeat-containing protein 57 [Sorochytrium milnesiophthora]